MGMVHLVKPKPGSTFLIETDIDINWFSSEPLYDLRTVRSDKFSCEKGGRRPAKKRGDGRFAHES